MCCAGISTWKTTKMTIKLLETDSREGKGRRCSLGDVLECRTRLLVARMILRKVFERTSISGGWWLGDAYSMSSVRSYY